MSARTNFDIVVIKSIVCLRWLMNREDEFRSWPQGSLQSKSFARTFQALYHQNAMEGAALPDSLKGNEHQISNFVLGFRILLPRS